MGGPPLASPREGETGDKTPPDCAKAIPVTRYDAAGTFQAEGSREAEGRCGQWHHPNASSTIVGSSGAR